MGDYWAARIAEDLSQGDLLGDVWLGTQGSPRAGLQRAPTGKGGVLNWQESSSWIENSDGFGHFLGRGRQVLSLVLSQSCEIDKRASKVPVLVAPVVALSGVSDASSRDNIRGGGRYAFFPLPALDGVLEESYVDLRAITYFPRALLDHLPRRASATSNGAHSLATHLVAFFTRIPLADLSA